MDSVVIEGDGSGQMTFIRDGETGERLVDVQSIWLDLAHDDDVAVMVLVRGGVTELREGPARVDIYLERCIVMELPPDRALECGELGDVVERLANEWLETLPDDDGEELYMTYREFGAEILLGEKDGVGAFVDRPNPAEGKAAFLPWLRERLGWNEVRIPSTPLELGPGLETIQSWVSDEAELSRERLAQDLAYVKAQLAGEDGGQGD